MLTTFMTTTTVGIRELKRDAARLVRLAARGTCFIVTRYGKPTAALGPIASTDEPADARTKAWQRERGAFERIEPSLRHRHLGKWVAIHGGRVVGSSHDAEELSRRMFRRFGAAAFFVGRVGGSPVIDLPGFEIA